MNSKTDSIPRNDITGVVLAGGRARRMDGVDKGLVEVFGRALIEYVLDALAPQVGTIVINANRNLDTYARYGYRVVCDENADHRGPLAGMLAGLQVARTPYVMFVPCDAPRLPRDLVARLGIALLAAGAEACAPHDGIRLQSVCVLLSRTLVPSISAALVQGRLKTEDWLRTRHLAIADYAGEPQAFLNINSVAEYQALDQAVRAAHRDSAR